MESGHPERPVDLTASDFDGWLALVFDHAVAAEGASEWYFGDTVRVCFDPGRHVAFLTRLFRQPEIVSGRYSPGQVEQGFWFLFGPGRSWFEGLLWDPSVPWEARRACIAALPEVYARLFEALPPGTIAYMLPDLLASDYRDGWRQPNASAEDRRVQQALFDAFRAMLASCHPETQRAALHGLGHLAHPETPEVVRTYLASQPGPDPTLRQYARDAAAGKVL